MRWIGDIGLAEGVGEETGTIGQCLQVGRYLGICAKRRDDIRTRGIESYEDEVGTLTRHCRAADEGGRDKEAQKAA